MAEAPEIWLRPWAAYDPAARLQPVDGLFAVPADHRGPLWFATSARKAAASRRLQDFSEPHVTFKSRSVGGGNLQLRQLALPLDRRGLELVLDAVGYRILWPSLPERPRQDDAPGRPLMLRAEAVWDRIRDVDDALEDPARLWQRLHERWCDMEHREPSMDIIVRHARALARVIERLERHPRRILRRVHRMLPAGRVQEVDRRSMLWMARQPGVTLAEKAGPAQRLLAVAREENFDTLENRVLRAYGELTDRHGRDYLDRNRTRRATGRARMVENFGRDCRRLARWLAAGGVRRADGDVTPNFVLLENPDYRQIWNAWLELRRSERVRDDLWRWQPRCWEEFCALAVMVALAGREPGKGEPVATSPLLFRDEQRRGSWIEVDSPLGVIHLPTHRLIFEVVRTQPGSDPLARLGAPIWLRVARLGDELGFSRHVGIWPLWCHETPHEQALAADCRSLASAFDHARHDGARNLAGGLILVPGDDPESITEARSGPVHALTLGTEGRALADALPRIAEILGSMITRELR